MTPREICAVAGAILRQERAQRGMTQAEVAAETGVTATTISRMEAGNPSAGSDDAWLRAGSLFGLPSVWAEAQLLLTAPDLSGESRARVAGEWLTLRRRQETEDDARAAEALGISPARYRRLERGEIRPLAEELEAIVKRYGVRYRVMCGRVSDPVVNTLANDWQLQTFCESYAALSAAERAKLTFLCANWIEAATLRRAVGEHASAEAKKAWRWGAVASGTRDESEAPGFGATPSRNETSAVAAVPPAAAEEQA